MGPTGGVRAKGLMGMAAPGMSSMSRRRTRTHTIAGAARGGGGASRRYGPAHARYIIYHVLGWLGRRVVLPQLCFSLPGTSLLRARMGGQTMAFEAAEYQQVYRPFTEIVCLF